MNILQLKKNIFLYTLKVLCENKSPVINICPWCDKQINNIPINGIFIHGDQKSPFTQYPPNGCVVRSTINGLVKVGKDEFYYIYHMKNNKFVNIGSDFYFECPYGDCGTVIVVNKKDIACKIFRHACFKTGGNIGPHSKKELCDRLVAEGKVYGCAKPFTFDGKTVLKCGYI